MNTDIKDGQAVLPEPDAAIKEVMGLVDEWGMESHLRGEAELDAQHPEATQEEINCAKDRASKERAAWKAIESKLRTLLTTATGLPAQTDARDAKYRKVDRRIEVKPLHNDALVKITWGPKDKKPQVTVTGWNINGNGTDLPGHPHCTIHAACNLLLDALENATSGNLEVKGQ